MNAKEITRSGGRPRNQMRDVTIQRHFMEFAEGSCLIGFGRTRVVCTVTVEDRVPPFLMGSGQGWVTAEYGMLPKSTKQRISREKAKGGRAQEIQRLIGRALRSVMDMDKLGERTLFIDCDVIQADGGTRTASITGAAVALVDALKFMQKNGLIQHWPMREMVAAVSVGLIDGLPYLDLDYNEDSAADVDFNVIKTESGLYVEVQGTAEHKPFSTTQLHEMLAAADLGIAQLLLTQKECLDRE